jgi:hypothetical protein
MKTLTIIGLFLAFTTSFVTAADPVGEIVGVKGESFIAHLLKPKKAAKVGEKVFAKDKIKTGADGEVVIDMYGESKLAVASSSYLKIPKKSSGKGSTELNLLGGKVGFEVKPLGGSQTFTVRSPSAVAGVRGTHGEMSFDMNSGVTGAQSREHTDGTDAESIVYTVPPGEEDMMNDAIAASREAEANGGNYDVGEEVLVVNEGQASFFMPDGEGLLIDIEPGRELSAVTRQMASDVRSGRAVKQAQGRFANMESDKIAYLEDLEQRLNNLVESQADARLPQLDLDTPSSEGSN